MTGGEIYPYNASNMVLSHVAEGATPTAPVETNNFNSRHLGGTQFVFADGHVQLLTSSLSFANYQALCTIAGNDSVGDY